MENSSSNTKQQSITTVQNKCKICEAPAAYSYFGVISCHPCKMFFKRNAERGQEALKCNLNGQCKINRNNGHICSYCRLKKCFSSGMQIEKIRSALPKKKKTSQKRKLIDDSLQNTSKALRRLNEPTQFSTLNLLESDQSTLTIDQWNLISNLSHCYDEHSGLYKSTNYMHQQDALPPKLRYKSASIIEMIGMLLDGIQLLYKSNKDFLSLSSDDRSILLHNTFKLTGSICSNFIIYVIRLTNNSAYFNTLELITHPDIIPIAKRIAERVDFDMIIMKLFLAIISFSTIKYSVYSNTPPVNLSNIKEILRIQNTYIELTWKYLLYKYNYKRTVMLFSDLIRCLFAVHEAVVKTEEIQWLTNTIDSLVQETEQSLTLNV